MELDGQAVMNELLDQNKQLSMQLAVARVSITQLQAQISQLENQLATKTSSEKK